MVVLDGSLGEGGGQLLRTALCLSLATGEPFRLHHIRCRRSNPGLARQHLAAVLVAAEIGQATVQGAALGSQELEFRPHGVRAGEFAFDVGSAGSVALVLQAVLPALLTANGVSELKLKGGTHNPMAPPFEFLREVLFPTLACLGAKLDVQLLAYGFYPAGGGHVQVRVEPSTLQPLVLEKRGEVQRIGAKVLLARLPHHVGARECEVVRRRLGWPNASCEVRQVTSRGPGNAVLLSAAGEGFAEVCSSFGRAGVAAEVVAEEACRGMERFLAAKVPVGEHLADQLLVPMALAGGGLFRTLPLTLHARTVIEVTKAFLPVEIMVSSLPGGAEEVEVVPGGVA